MASLADIFSALTPYLRWLGGISAVMFIFSLILVPALICKIPADYFQQSRHRHKPANKIAGIRYSLIYVARNLIGIALFLAGVLMLVLPGQGLLTIVLSLFVAEFPGKRKVENRLVSVRAIHSSINWIREKRGVERLALPPA